MAFWNRNKNRGREPTADKPNTSEQYKMVTTWVGMHSSKGESYRKTCGKTYTGKRKRVKGKPQNQYKDAFK